MGQRWVLLVLLLLPATLHGDAPGVWAITGGTVHPVSGAPIPDGVVVIRGGLIEAVGAGVVVPADAMVVDAAGKHVYPGLIDAHTSFGFTAGKAGDPDPGPDALALRTVKLAEDEEASRRAAGVTTIVAVPSSGIFNGQSVMLNLGEAPLETRVVKSPAAQHIAFNTKPTWTFPDSLMGVIAHIRQQFLDAQHHHAAHEIYDRSPAGLRRPAESPALEALGPALRREIPVVFLADSEPMMWRALALAREFSLRPILAGGRQGWRMADDLRDVPVLVSVRWPVAPTDKEDREEQPLRLIRERQLAPTTPAELARRRATFALVSGAGKAGDFLPGIRKAMENGLSAEDALRATTIAPATIFGVQRQLGTLERGKIANVVVADGPLFAEKTRVVRVFVDGRDARLPREDAAPAGASTSPIDGTWAITIRAPEGNLAMQITLRAEDGRLTGSWSGDRGSGEVRSGTFGEGRFEFTIAAPAQNEAETTDWVFAGTVDGDTMSGSVTTTLGKFEFSGSRSK